MKSPTLLVTSLLLILVTGSAVAQQDDFPDHCPELPDQASARSKPNVETAGQAAAATLVAEAQTALSTPSPQSLTAALSLAGQAILADPQNVEAYLVLARAHAGSQRYLNVPKQLARARAWENLTKARMLDPANIEGLHLLADNILARNQDYACARKIFEAALAFDPQNARSNYYYSQILSAFGEFDLAFRYGDIAMAIADDESRDFVTVNAGRLRYMAGEYDWVLAHYALYLESHPNHWLAHFYRSLAFGAKGQFPEALTEARKSMPDAPKGDAGGIGMLALAYANAGQTEKARELLDELLQRDARGEHVVEYRIAAVCEVLGRRDEAILWLGKAIDDRDGIGSWLLWLNYDPVWDDLRNDPRFAEIQERAGWATSTP